MNIIISEFFLFTVVAVINAYLPLFLRAMNYSATQVGFLFSIFNLSGILIPIFLTPLIAKKNKFSLWLFIFNILQAITAVLLFKISGFIFTLIFIAIYAGVYKGCIPIADSLINTSINNNSFLYGIIRGSGTLGFIVMSLFMQKMINMDSISINQMIMWLAVPALLCAFTLILRQLYIKFSKQNLKKQNKTIITKEEKSSSSLSLLKEFNIEFYLVMFMIFMQYMGMLPSNQFLSMYVKEELNSNATGFLWALNSIFELPFMFLSGFLIKKFKDEPLIIAGTVFVIIRLLIYAFIPNLTGAALGQCTHAITFGLFYPSCVAYCTRICRGNTKKLLIAMTILATVNGLSFVIGAFFGGIIIDNSGYKVLFLIFTLFPAAGLIPYIINKAIKLHLDSKSSH